MQIGKKLRQIRREKDISLTVLAEKSGVQMATLSRIENLKMTGTLESHMAIAKALEVELVELYKDAEKDQSSLSLTKSHTATDVFVHNTGSSYEILTNNVFLKKMMPILLKIEPGGKTTAEQSKADTERFIFVLEGKISVDIDGESLSLSKNNSLYFDAGLKHTISNVGKATARIISVTTPAAL